MSGVQIFHATLDGARELKESPFQNEKELQRLFESHLHSLTGIDHVATEHRTGSRHKRRADTLGLDSKQRPVVIEYKLGHGGAAISQGLDYLYWLEDHKGDFRELVRGSLDADRSRHIDFKNARLLCVAEEFRREDIINADTNTRSIELLCVRRLGESIILMEWVIGGDEKPKPDPVPIEPNHEPDFSKYKYWEHLVDNRELHRVFEALREHASTLGDDVRVYATKHNINLARKRRFGYITVRPQRKLFLLNVQPDPDPRNVRLQEGFTRLQTDKQAHRPFNLQITIRSHADLKRAKDLIKRSYNEAG